MSEVYGSSWHGTYVNFLRGITSLFFYTWRFAQIRSIATVTTAVAQGDLTHKIEIQVEGEMATLNSMGILGGQARVESVQGTWADSILNVNKMASNLTDQVRSISEVTKAIALGDFSKQVEVDVQGEMLDLKMTVNSMVNQLSTLANEVTRVSLEVGTEGNLGGQAYVPDVQGMWKSQKTRRKAQVLLASAGAVEWVVTRRSLRRSEPRRGLHCDTRRNLVQV
ncbi:hypothetical protein EDB85DRAFT_2287972 [Lactarius pseudohatsudake]|nr:hypothetical protein EDB85DRAFT_2287972 [Lactarius pseudohatsudake]